MNKEELPYAVVQRLRMIDITLDVLGVVKRQVLADYFGITTGQASHDFSQYIQLAPNNMTYDLSAKTYRRSATFARIWP